jgi:transcriptional regulator with XRE-family HTH domain
VSAKRPEIALSRAFEGVATVRVDEEREGSVRATVDVYGRALVFRVLWAGGGKPQDVQRVIGSVADPWPTDSVVVAAEMSGGAVALLVERGANWADETGRAHIRAPGLAIVRETKAPVSRRSGLPWSPSAMEIAEALLSRSWPQGIGTGDVARLTGWSPAQVSAVLQSFDSRGWTRKLGPQRGPGSRRDLVATEEFLDAWARAVADEPAERRLAHAMSPSIMELLRDGLGETLNERVRWAITGWAAGELVSPIMTHIPSLQIYVAEEDFHGPLTEAIQDSELREVDEGGSIEFRSGAPAVFSLATEVEQVPVVSHARLYADLLRLGGRGEDAARHVWEELIQPLHRPLTLRPASPALERWEEDCRRRLDELVEAAGPSNPYEHGHWSAAYRLPDVGPRTSIRTLREALLGSVGTETGWPAWWFPPDESRPRVVEGVIECWISPRTFGDSAHQDFWRADPAGLAFLLRGFEEDGGIDDLTPGTALDLILPVWRTGECLRHAERLAARLEAERVEFAMRWQGLRGRRLGAVAGRRRYVGGDYRCEQDVVTSHVELEAATITEMLPQAVQALVDPLYASFDFFEAPDALYREELSRLVEDAAPGWKVQTPR